MSQVVPAWYGLDGRVVTAHDAELLLSDWRRRVVAEDVIPSGPVVVLVVTAFTVAPVGSAGPLPPHMEAAPILWETMVTAENSGALVGRYRSLDEARSGHSRVVAHVHQLLQTHHPGQALEALTRGPTW